MHCAGEGLPDPTRPPAHWGAQDESSEVPAAGPELQSVLISPTRRLATVSGQVLQVGDRFGEARVVKIMENEVVLRTGKDIQVLKLFPQIEKRRDAGTRNGKPKIGSK